MSQKIDHLTQVMKFQGKYILHVFFALFWVAAAAQEEAFTGAPKNEFYREDQIYFGFNYDLLSDVPDATAIRGLIGGLQFGFIRDWPLTSQGNFALGTGVGLAYDRYGQNIVVRSNSNEAQVWTVEQSPSAIETNSLQITALEFPLQIRWRTSDAKSYKFWRLYSGVKWSQHISAKTVYQGTEGSQTLTDLSGLNKGIWYATFSFGYGTFNAHIQWGLSPLLNQVSDSNTQDPIGLRPIKLGIVFYIL